MKMHSLTTTLTDADSLDREFKAGREIGIIKLGERCLFFRKYLKIYYIPYQDITRAFRRVMEVPMKMCCGKGEFQMEYLVICAGEQEIAQIQLPGTKAARLVMDELKSKLPDAQFSSPKSEDKKA